MWSASFEHKSFGIAGTSRNFQDKVMKLHVSAYLLVFGNGEGRPAAKLQICDKFWPFSGLISKWLSMQKKKSLKTQLYVVVMNSMILLNSISDFLPHIFCMRNFFFFFIFGLAQQHPNIILFTIQKVFLGSFGCNTWIIYPVVICLKWVLTAAATTGLSLIKYQNRVHKKNFKTTTTHFRNCAVFILKQKLKCIISDTIATHLAQWLKNL